VERAVLTDGELEQQREELGRRIPSRSSGARLGRQPSGARSHVGFDHARSSAGSGLRARLAVEIERLSAHVRRLAGRVVRNP